MDVSHPLLHFKSLDPGSSVEILCTFPKAALLGVVPPTPCHWSCLELPRSHGCLVLSRRAPSARGIGKDWGKADSSQHIVRAIETLALLLALLEEGPGWRMGLGLDPTGQPASSRLTERLLSSGQAAGLAPCRMLSSEWAVSCALCGWHRRSSGVQAAGPRPVAPVKV